MSIFIADFLNVGILLAYMESEDVNWVGILAPTWLVTDKTLKVLTISKNTFFSGN